MGVREWTGSRRGKIAGFCEYRSAKLGYFRQISEKPTF
jgi:hypothetical protein